MINEMPEKDKSLETRIALLEQQFASYAPREWVKDFIKPVQDSVNRMESIVNSLSEKADHLFDAHDSLLREKAEQERKGWLERTPLGLIKKYGPVVTFIVGIVAIYRLAGSLLENWIRAHGF